MRGRRSIPTLNGAWSGMYVEFGHTWKGHFNGYSNADLMTLPRVVTETGWTTGAPAEINDEQEGRLYVSMYLSAFKQGFTHAFIYMLRDEPESGAWAMLGMFESELQAEESGDVHSQPDDDPGRRRSAHAWKAELLHRQRAGDRARSALAEEQRRPSSWSCGTSDPLADRITSWSILAPREAR